MFKTHFIHFIIIVSFIFTQATIKAQEFPIAVGTDTTFSGGAVFGLVDKGLVAIQGDNTNPYSINAQIITYPGTLVGSRISLNDEGTPPGAIPLFDGRNYFLVWCNFDNNLRGQFIDTAGNLAGTPFTIASSISTEGPGRFGFALGGDSILVVYEKTDGFLYGRLVDKFRAEPVGNETKISNNYARELAIAFDGTNYLVAWVEQIPEQSDKNIYGQFVSRSGALIGSNFTIDDGPYYSDNPISLAYDGTRYLLAFHETTNSKGDHPKWALFGKFITKSGTIQETISICDSSKLPFLPSVAFDGTNYFITWTQFSNYSLMGQFFSVSGNPIGEPFVVISPSGNKIPIGGVGFGGGSYLVVATKVDSNFSDGDVYGRFIQPLTGVENENDLTPETFVLFQNYPNPFNPTTTFTFTLPVKSFVSLKIFDALGKEVATLFSEELSAGKHSKQWDASGLPSGVYFYRLQAGLFTETKKLILLR